MAKHKSVTIRVAKLNAANKHKITLIIDGKAVKAVFISKADVTGGAVKRLIGQWSKIADHVVLVYAGQRATYCRSGSTIERTALVKTATGGKPTGDKRPTTKMRAGAAAFRSAYKAFRAGGLTHKQALAAWKKGGAVPVKVKTKTKPKVSGRKVGTKAKAGLKAFQAFVKAQKKAGKTHKQAVAAWKSANAKGLLHKTSKKVGTKAKTVKIGKRKVGTKAKAGLAKYRAFMKAQKKAGKTPKQALAAWHVDGPVGAGGIAAAAKAKTPKAAKVKTKKTSGRGKSKYNIFVKNFLKANPGLGKTGIKKAAAAWRAQGGGGSAVKAKKAKAPKAAKVKATKAKTKKSGRGKSPYNHFVKSFIAAHPGKGIKEAAAAWRAKGGGSAKPAKVKTKSKAKTKLALVKAPKAPKAQRGVLPNPADVLSQAALRTARRHKR